MSTFDESAHPRHGDGRWATKELDEVDPGFGLTPDQVKDAAELHARNLKRKFGMGGDGADDLASRVMVEFYENYNKDSDASVRYMDAERQMGVIYAIARGLASREVSGFRRGSDFAAQRAFDREEAAIQQQEGRVLTAMERDALGENIRSRFDPQHKPRHKFWEGRQREMGLSDDVDSAIPPHHDPVLDDDDAGADQFMADLGNILSSTDGDRPLRRSELAAVWVATANRTGARYFAEGSLTERQASKARRVVSDSGGPGRLVAAWRNETITAEQEAALFAPFGDDLSFDEQDRLCSAIEVTSEPYRELVWSTAVSGATIPRQPKSAA